jgi:hypothetical protein
MTKAILAKKRGRCLVAGFIAPCLPTKTDKLPSGGQWLHDAARAMGLQIQVLNASNRREIDAAFTSLARDRPDALFVSNDAFFNNRRVQLVHLASHHAVPATYGRRDFAVAGGLISYGADITDAYREVGVYAGRILKGTKPVDLPVVQSTKFEAGHQSPDRPDARPHRAPDAWRGMRSLQFTINENMPWLAD